MYGARFSPDRRRRFALLSSPLSLFAASLRDEPLRFAMLSRSLSLATATAPHRVLRRSVCVLRAESRSRTTHDGHPTTHTPRRAAPRHTVYYERTEGKREREREESNGYNAAR